MRVESMLVKPLAKCWISNVRILNPQPIGDVQTSTLTTSMHEKLTECGNICMQHHQAHTKALVK